ncbi:MAG TPA: hypothetical protein VM553_16000 [Dongiaceae bacterium]|nr:hypothetical protein [Dongiaceae bacterium]
MKALASFSHFHSSFSLFAVLALLCQSLMLSGCSTHSALMEQQVQQQTSNQDLIQKVTQALEATEARLAKAQASDVGTYSPSQLAKAESALQEARRYTEHLQDDPDLVNQSMSLLYGESMGDKTLALISKANESLTLAEENKQQADAIFAAVNDNFVWLNKFQAPTYFPYEYKDLQRAQKQMEKDVAGGDLNQAQKQLPRLLSEQRALEIVSAQRFYLHDLSLRAEREGRGDLERYAPISYSSALAALNKTKSVIAQNPRDESAILAAKKHAEFSVDVAHAVATDMERLTSMERQNMERWLILVAAKLNEMGKAVGAEDVRNKELVQQLELLATVAAQKGVPAQTPAPVATTEPAAPKAEEVAAAKEPATPPPTESQAMDHRMTQLEQSIGEQLKALSDQINAMKQVDVTTQAITYPVPMAPPLGN